MSLLETIKRNDLEIVNQASTVIGVSAFADGMLRQHTDYSLHLRGLLPEPFDIFNSGMSMAMGSAMAASGFYLYNRRQAALDSRMRDTVVDELAAPQQRRGAGNWLVKKAGRAAVAGLLAGTAYMTVGEVMSEVGHRYADEQEADKPAEERKGLPIGHFDWYDMAYGIGTAGLCANLRRKRTVDPVREILATLPTSPAPKQVTANKRYTPPKSQRPR